MRVVVDTNVWVSGLIHPEGPPGQVLAAIRAGSLEPVVSWELAAELVDVLRRPKLRRYEFSEEQVAALLVVLARWLPTVDIEVELRDTDDAPVVAAAIAGEAAAIVTGDRDLLENRKLSAWLEAHRVDVLTPAQLLERIESAST